MKFDHEPFRRFIETYGKIARMNGLNCDLSLDVNGKVATKSERWNLRSIVGAPSPPFHWLSDLGFDRPTLALVNSIRIDRGQPPLTQQPITEGWRLFVMALATRALFELKNSPGHVANGVITATKRLATAVYPFEPWELSASIASDALHIIGNVGKSGQAQQLAEAILIIIDDNRLSKFCPVVGDRTKRTRKLQTKTNVIRDRVDERRRADRLPVSNVFWELLRILLEERPSSFYDEVRFEALLLGVLMELRAEEFAAVPVDPIITQQYFDWKGDNPTNIGGIGHTMFLKHFSEKQNLRSTQDLVYAEDSTSILDVFEPELQRVVEVVSNMTSPLRARLKAQISSGRIFPEYDLNTILRLSEVYPMLTGNPFVCEDDQTSEYIEKYRQNHSPEILVEIAERQRALETEGVAYTQNMRIYFSRPKNSWFPKIDMQTGQPAQSGARLRTIGIRVRDLEATIRINLPTKLSDTEGFPIESGETLEVYNCLFLVPKRALAEGRDGLICDVNRYAFVGRLASSDISTFLQPTDGGIFRKYGQETAKGYKIMSHSFRHMHNTELFAAGVSDTIITHRFGRKSIAQTHAYDSRTLVQELAAMDLPEGSHNLVMGPTEDVLKLIMSGRGRGPIVDEFRKIQAEEGDEAAIIFLATEADGMQITPYGVCLNSFVVEPCPRHLECFNGCCHLMRTGDAAEALQLQKLHQRYTTLLGTLDEHPGSPSAKQNARLQAVSRLEGIAEALATAPGDSVFPDGPDLSRPYRPNPFSGLIE